METAAIHFRSKPRIDRKRAFEALEKYLGALWRNGQVLGEDHIASARAGYSIFVSLPAPDALHPRHANRHVRRAVRSLAEAGLGPPRVRRLGADPQGRPACTCRRQPFLIMFASKLHGDSPVRCGDCFHPVPLYRFPTTGEFGDYHDILWWSDTFEAIDWLWIGSGVGERWAHDQMARHDSALSKDGREVARTLERRARRPVYYYLAKARARSERAERARRCPSCGRAWLLKDPLHEVFDFQCVRCRLLSNIVRDVRPWI